MKSMLLVAVLLGGCVQDSNIACGDLLCPSTAICVADHICATTEQVERCTGVADGEPCSGDGAAGICVASLCQPLVCGDGVMVGDEQCDDGNQRSGDGCSADCQSLETCGNGIADPLAHEECDDGNRASRDGCTSTCQVEVGLWSELQATGPTPRTEPAVAYDARRGRLVMFGGATGGGVLDDTWELAGSTWRRIESPISPPARPAYWATYDAKHGVVVLVSGTPTATWTWDGDVWTLQHPATELPAASAIALAYDPHDEQVIAVVMPSGGAPSRTLAWDGATWSALTTQLHPDLAPRLLAANPATNELIAVSYDGTTTWAWRGQQWVVASTSPIPGYIVTASLVGLGTRGLALVAVHPTLLTDPSVAYRFTGAKWEVLPTTGLPELDGAGVAFDSNLTRVVAFDGSHPDVDGIATTYALDPTTLGASPVASIIPYHSQNACVVADPITHGIAWFNTDPTAPLPALRFDGAWTPIATQSRPGRGAAIVATRAGAFAYAGSLDDGESSFTITPAGAFTWDGTSWSGADSPTKPPARVAAALAYDSARDRVVMVGGLGAGSDHGTWEWTGTDWTLVPDAGAAPSARDMTAMAYDPERHRVVLFGGIVTVPDATLILGDTWEYDGTTWVKLTPAVAPAPRAYAAMTWDPARHTVILDGGSASASFDDTWEWNGTEWKSLHAVVRAPARSRHSIAWDAVREQLVMTGGSLAAVGWAHRFTATDHPPDACTSSDTDGDTLVGCADPDCAPRCDGCGDGTCDPILETHALCAMDCP